MSTDFSNGHALLIGVGTYQHQPWLNVPITADDADGVAQVLMDTAYCGYPKGQVHLCQNLLASRKNILDTLKQLADGLQESDTLLLFYSGHGDYGTDGKYYLSTTETEFKDKRVVAGSGLAEDELLQALRAIKVKKMFSLFNACHAGAISPVLGKPDEALLLGTVQPPARMINQILSEGDGYVIITACRPGQYSVIGSGELTIFAQALVDGLKGSGVTPNHGYIGAYALYESIFDSVKASAQHNGYTQEPELTVLKGVGPFPVALFNGGETLGAYNPKAESLTKGLPVRTVQPVTNISGGIFNINWTVKGNVYQSQGDMYINMTTPDAGELSKLFTEVKARVDALAEDDQEVVAPIVNQAEQQAAQIQAGVDNEVTRSALEKRLRNLWNMAPDIAEVTLAMLANPAAGIALTIRKIAAKVQTELQGSAPA